MMRFISHAVLLCFFASGCAHSDKKDEKMNSDTPPPKLLAPSVKKIWIPAETKNGGTEWEEGHFLFRIERGTTWSR